MRIIIGSDQRGFQLKQFLIENLNQRKDTAVKDVGCFSEESVDYPKVATILAKEMESQLENTFGIIICGSGVGVSVAVNRFPFVRGALVFNKEVASLSRKHNNANVICLGADFISSKEALDYVETFLSESFDGDRHQRRVDQLSSLC